MDNLIAVLTLAGLIVTIVKYELDHSQMSAKEDLPES